MCFAGISIENKENGMDDIPEVPSRAFIAVGSKIE
jgi:hypothetical protein